ncbi:MAG TPA: TlpA disulfide reductase family protein [Candidatus Limnocylindrales bacterium]|nr:TlpA disulfide reductase family protein [Candidatus Limnocylindrales bacterium]
MTERPEFVHRRERHGLIGPFGGRQLAVAALAVIVAAVVLIAVTTPLVRTGPGVTDPRATPFILGPAPSQGLKAGDLAPEFTVPLTDGTTYQLTDLDGRPVRLADLRGKAVWINFWASWCPPCQSETPVLRDLAERYKDRGLVVVGISVQETSVDDVRAYAQRYQLGYTVAADLSGNIFRLYRLYGLPTQFFVGPEGAIRSVVLAPMTEAAAVAQIEAILPKP